MKTLSQLISDYSECAIGGYQAEMERDGNEARATAASLREGAEGFQACVELDDCGEAEKLYNAAPELLAACQLALKTLWVTSGPLFDALTSAITKATGSEATHAN